MVAKYRDTTRRVHIKLSDNKPSIEYTRYSYDEYLVSKDKDAEIQGYIDSTTEMSKDHIEILHRDGRKDYSAGISYAILPQVVSDMGFYWTDFDSDNNTYVHGIYRFLSEKNKKPFFCFSRNGHSIFMTKSLTPEFPKIDKDKYFNAMERLYVPRELETNFVRATTKNKIKED